MRVLVATDLSQGSDAALWEGARAAAPTDPLAVVHVSPHPNDRGTASDDDVRHAALHRVGDHAATVVGRAVEVFVDHGTDHARIVERAEAWKADLLVVGSQGQSGRVRGVGHVARRIARNASCDVLVARAWKEKGDGLVLAATDLSRPSLPAIRAGAYQAQRRRVPLEVVHVSSFLDVEADYLFELASPAVAVAAYDDERVRRLLSHALTRMGIDAESKVVHGSAAAAIVSEANAIGATLIVVGTHGRSGLARVIRGSVAASVMSAAACSVLLVQPQSGNRRRAQPGRVDSRGGSGARADGTSVAGNVRS